MLETNSNDASALALHALGWILTDERRAERMLSLTGLTPDGLRDAVREPGLQAAILRFLENHEPDLVACAGELGLRPEALVAARRELEA
jgi:hypothetical protein